MERKQRIAQRNKKVRDKFNEISTKNPKWKTGAVITDVANMFFLSDRTVEAILSFEGKTYSI